ncbi:MAG TPA: hypothetical protein VEJ44_04000 [Acidimicrobiales bacterium]|nr:hypothetical protein [Acidimicrobiales bacterium]
MNGPQLTFSRRVDQPFGESLGAIASWHPQLADFEEGCASIDADASASRLTRTVRMRRIVRSVPMELVVSQWSSTEATLLELLPLRAVRPSRRYFAKGRALLDDAAETIASAR